MLAALPTYHPIIGQRRGQLARFLALSRDPWIVVQRCGVVFEQLFYQIDRRGRQAFLEPDRTVPATGAGYRRDRLLPEPAPVSRPRQLLLEVLVEARKDGQVWPVDIRRYRGRDLDALPLAERLTFLAQACAELQLPKFWLTPSVLTAEACAHLERLPGLATLLCRDLRASYRDAVAPELFLVTDLRKDALNASGPGQP